MESLLLFYKELFAVGARRIGIISAPPIGCLPSQRTLGGGIERKCVEKYNQVAKLFNRKLMAELERLDNNNVVQARVAYMDAYNPLMDIFENHEKYGNLSPISMLVEQRAFYIIKIIDG